MARKLISKSHINLVNGRSFKVYKDTEWDEYIVEFYRDGEHQKGASYHTDDIEDAKQTANTWHSGAI